LDCKAVVIVLLSLLCCSSSSPLSWPTLSEEEPLLSAPSLASSPVGNEVFVMTPPPPTVLLAAMAEPTPQGPAKLLSRIGADLDQMARDYESLRFTSRNNGALDTPPSAVPEPPAGLKLDLEAETKQLEDRFHASDAATVPLTNDLHIESADVNKRLGELTSEEDALIAKIKALNKDNDNIDAKTTLRDDADERALARKLHLDDDASILGPHSKAKVNPRLRAVPLHRFNQLRVDSKKASEEEQAANVRRRIDATKASRRRARAIRLLSKRIQHAHEQMTNAQRAFDESPNQEISDKARVDQHRQKVAMLHDTGLVAEQHKSVQQLRNLNHDS